ncbi:MAG: hypothetical protein R6V75_02025 [Bacteroidales bacterium]
MSASGIGGSWIGLYRADGTDGQYLTYQYINEKIDGTIVFDGREETGLFNFRLFRGGGYDKIATSGTFMIRQGALIDPTFLGTGAFHQDLSGNELDDWASAIRIGANDQILVAGTARTGRTDDNGYQRNDALVVRLHSDGTPDESFGASGIARIDLSEGSYLGYSISYLESRALVIQESGKVIVGGNASVVAAGVRAQALVMIRLTVSGLLDESFGDRGVRVDNFKYDAEPPGYAWDEVRCMELDQQGRILVGGGSLLNAAYMPGRPFIARYLGDGTPDYSFGGLRMITPADSVGFRGYVESIIPPTLGGDGTILTGITSVSQSGMNHYVLTKLDDTGTPVPSFGGTGIVVERRPGYHNSQYLKSIGLNPNGNLILLGRSGEWLTWLAGRKADDGSVINSFGNQGLTVVDATYGSDVPAGMKMTANGQIVVGMSTMGNRWSIARLNSDGTLQTDFGIAFHLLQESGSQVQSYIQAFTMQSDGSYLLAGFSKFPDKTHYDLMILRFKDNPETFSGVPSTPALTSHLSQNFPNPFSQSTSITWSQDSDAPVKLSLYDIYGRLIRDLVDEYRPAGKHQITVDRISSAGYLPAGHYLYRLSIQPKGTTQSAVIETRKMTLL